MVAAPAAAGLLLLLAAPLLSEQKLHAVAACWAHTAQPARLFKVNTFRYACRSGAPSRKRERDERKRGQSDESEVRWAAAGGWHCCSFCCRRLARAQFLPTGAHATNSKPVHAYPALPASLPPAHLACRRSGESGGVSIPSETAPSSPSSLPANSRLPARAAGAGSMSASGRGTSAGMTAAAAAACTAPAAAGALGEGVVRLLCQVWRVRCGSCL